MGRKEKLFPEKEIDKIIYRFTQEEKVSGWIKYSEVFRYANRLYENGEIPYKLSEDYWRREGKQGKKAIDKVNKTYEAKFNNSKTSKSEVYIDTEECVDKFFTGKQSDKKRLIQALKLNEKKAKDYNELLGKIDDLKGTIESLITDKKSLEEKLDQYEMILFSWFYSSIKSDVPLTNLLTTGKSRDPIVDLFFENAFSNPKEGYNQLIEKARKKLLEGREETLPAEKRNVTPLIQGIEALRKKHKKE